MDTGVKISDEIKEEHLKCLSFIGISLLRYTCKYYKKKNGRVLMVLTMSLKDSFLAHHSTKYNLHRTDAQILKSYIESLWYFIRQLGVTISRRGGNQLLVYEDDMDKLAGLLRLQGSIK